jgi:ankyrin repeat protein
LNVAVAKSDRVIAEYLISRGGNVSDCSPLHTAVQNNDLQMTNLLLENGADPNFFVQFDRESTSIFRFSPFELAMENNSFDLAVLLAQSGATSNVVSPFLQHHPILNSFKRCHLRFRENPNRNEYCQIFQILVENGTNLNGDDRFPSLLDVYASSYLPPEFNHEVIYSLIRKRAKFNELALDDPKVIGIFNRLIDDAKLEEVKAFLEFGMDPNVCDEHAGTCSYPLSRSAIPNHPDSWKVVQLLLDYGAGKNLDDGERITFAGCGIPQSMNEYEYALYSAAGKGNAKTVEVLMDSEKIKIHDFKNLSDLIHCAANSGSSETLIQLVTAAGGFGQFRIHKSVIEKHPAEVLEMYLSAGAQFSKYLLELAVSLGDLEKLRALTKNLHLISDSDELMLERLLKPTAFLGNAEILDFLLSDVKLDLTKHDLSEKSSDFNWEWYLRYSGADLTIGEAAVFYAATGDIVDLLVENGVEVRGLVDAYGRTPLFFTDGHEVGYSGHSRFKDFSALKRLVEDGVDINGLSSQSAEKFGVYEPYSALVHSIVVREKFIEALDLIALGADITLEAERIRSFLRHKLQKNYQNYDPPEEFVELMKIFNVE